MVIQTFPPRRMCRVIAVRAASIWRLVTYACSSAWMPYSPNATLVPPLAAPCRSGRCCLRCAVLRGMSMPQPSSATVATGSAPSALAALPALPVGRGVSSGAWPPGPSPAGGRAPGPVAGGRAAAPGGRAVPVAPLAGPHRGLERLALGAGGGRLAAVDPDLDPDPAERGACLVEAVVDVGAQRVQRHPPLAVELRARHLRAAEAARALHPDPARAALHGRLHGLAHRTAERHPARQLLGHALGDQLGVDLGVLDLEDVELDLLAGELLQVAADPVGLRAAPPDDDAGPRRVNVYPDPVPGALDLHLGDAGALHAALQHPADGDILGDVILVQLV